MEWNQERTCIFCGTRFTCQKSNLKYKDLRRAESFLDDWQYYANCTNCGKRNIIKKIPFDVCLEVQLFSRDNLYYATELDGGGNDGDYILIGETILSGLDEGEGFDTGNGFDS
jgi:hypothetical protein